MSDKQYKLIRKELKNIVQDLLPAVLSNELMLDIQKRLSDIVKHRLDIIDDRMKDVQSYIVRNSVANAPVAPVEPKKEG